MELPIMTLDYLRTKSLENPSKETGGKHPFCLVNEKRCHIVYLREKGVFHGMG